MSIAYLGSTDTLYILNKLKAVLDGTSPFTPGYVQKVAGKGLSTEDFTTALLTKLNGITDSADAVSWNQISQTGTKVAEITINGTTIDVYVPASSVITMDTEMSDSSENAVQNKVIKAYVDNAVGAVVQIKFDADTTGLGYTSLSDLQTKHPTGANGTIYLVQNSGSGTNTKDEYFWNSAGSTPRYEKFGSTDIDLSGYVQRTELVEVTTSDIDTMFNSVFGNSGT
jgi:hypothetical protein